MRFAFVPGSPEHTAATSSGLRVITSPEHGAARAEAASMPQLSPALGQGIIQMQVETRPEAAAAIDGEAEHRPPQHSHLLLELLDLIVERNALLKQFVYCLILRCYSLVLGLVLIFQRLLCIFGPCKEICKVLSG